MAGVERLQQDATRRPSTRRSCSPGIPTSSCCSIAFGSAVAAGIPLILALAGIAVGFAALHLLGDTTPLSVWSMNFSMMIGLAVGIDYSLFIVSRYREEREDGFGAARRHRQHPLHRRQGRLPLRPGRRPLARRGVRRARHGVPVDGARHDPVGRRRRPGRRSPCCPPCSWPSATGCWSPAATTTPTAPPRVAGPDGPAWPCATPAARSSPASPSSCARRPGGRHAPRHARRTGRGPGTIQPRRLRDGRPSPSDPAPRPRCSSPCRPPGPEWSTSRSGRRQRGRRPGRRRAGRQRPHRRPRHPRPTAVDAQRDLRPWSGGCAPPSGTPVPDAAVGGPAAQNHDLTAVLIGRAPIAIGLIMVVAFILLLVVFRSLDHRPVVSVLLNLISVGASFGFATLVFQHGFGAGLIGIQPQGFVDAWAPLFFFALLFGLVDGLPALPAGRDPGALRSHRRHQARHPGGHRPHRAPHHQRRPHHDRGVHRLRRDRSHPTRPSSASPWPSPSCSTPPSSG